MLYQQKLGATRSAAGVRGAFYCIFLPQEMRDLLKSNVIGAAVLGLTYLKKRRA